MKERGRTEEAIQVRASMVGIADSRRTWTEEEEQFIEEYWQEMSDDELAEELDRSPGPVKRKRLRMGLKKWPKEENPGPDWTTDDDDEFLEQFFGSSESG